MNERVQCSESCSTIVCTDVVLEVNRFCKRRPPNLVKLNLLSDETEKQETKFS